MYNFKFADIGEGIHEGVIHEWLVNEGDQVKDGQTLFLVETDKVTAEIPSPVDGVIEKINFKVGQTIHVGEVAVVINDGSGGQAAATKEPPQETRVESVEEAGSTSVVGEIEVSSELIPSSQESQVVAKSPHKTKVLATPVARKLAKDLGVDIQDVRGTGPAGRVMKEDILAHHEASQPGPVAVQAQSHQQAPVPAIHDQEGDERISMTSLRKTIAKNMVLSKFTIPHTAAMDEVNVSQLVAYRKAFNAKFAESHQKVTYMPFIIKAVALALKDHPIINASLDETTMEIVLKKAINIGIATDTPEGLMVPVIHGANQKGIMAIQESLLTLADKAKNHTVQMADLTGGTFTITNYGSIGAKFGVPVIKHPEAAIIGIGTIYKTTQVNQDNEIEIIDALPLSLSFDHRIIDGADAGRFLQTLKAYLSDPDLLLMS